MDYFQGVVTEFLRANRSTFVNTEYCIQLDAGCEPQKSRHWYCDAVAADFRNKTISLCEVTYSKSLHALVTRFRAWNNCWPLLCEAIKRDCSVPDDWSVRPHAFIPANLREKLNSKLATGIYTKTPCTMPYPKITTLEEVVPWKYCTWNREHQVEENDV